MMSPVINFSLKLVAALAVVFGIHIFILDTLKQPKFSHLIVESYLVNAFLAIVIYASLFLLKKKYLDVLGFIFMAGSFLKFGVYFIFFYPSFKADGLIIKQEALSFLTPYICSLIIETYFLVKLLNNED